MTERLRYILSAEGIGAFKSKIKQATGAVEDGSKKIVNGFKAIAGGATAYLAIEAVKAVGRAVFALGELAEETRVVGISFDRLAKGVGQSSNDMLRALRRGTNGAVKDLDLMQQANKAILLGIPVTAEKMEQLSKVAVRLGRAVGRTATEALDDLVTGIGRMSPLILDNLGITIKAEEAFRSLGEGATDAQKRLAFFNAVMSKANTRSEEIGDTGASLTEVWDKFTASTSNFAGRLGSDLVPALNKVIGFMGTLVKTTESWYDSFKRILDEAKEEAGGASVGGRQKNTTIANKKVAEQKKKDDAVARGAEIRAELEASKNDAMASVRRARVSEILRNTEDIGSLGFRFGRGERYDANMKRTSYSENIEGGRDYKTTTGGFRRNTADETFNEQAQLGENFKDFAKGLTDSLERAKPEVKKTFEEMGEDADDIFDSVAQRFGQSMQQSSARIEFGLNQLGIKTNGFFSGLSQGATGLRTLMPKNKDAEGLQTTLGLGLDRMANIMMPLGQLGAGFQTIKSAFGFIQGLNSKPDLTKFSDEELDERIANIEKIQSTGGKLRGASEMEKLRAIEERDNREALKGGTSSGSQSFQSVSRITESQADQMAGILNSILVTNQSMDNKLGSLVQSSRNIEFFAGNGSISQLTEFQGI